MCFSPLYFDSKNKNNIKNTYLNDILNMSSSNKKSSCEDGEREFKLGLRYENGEGVQQDLFVAVQHYQQAVRHGHVGAIVKLGKAYQSGCGISKDQGKAIELFKKAM